MTDKLRDLIIEQVEECKDADLLDLIYKLPYYCSIIKIINIFYFYNNIDWLFPII